MEVGESKRRDGNCQSRRVLTRPQSHCGQIPSNTEFPAGKLRRQTKPRTHVVLV